MYFKQLTTPVPQAILPAYQVGYSDNNPGRTPEQVAELSIEQIIKETRTNEDSANILNYYFANKELCNQPLLLAILISNSNTVLLYFRSIATYYTKRERTEYDQYQYNAYAIESLMSIFIKCGLFKAYMDGNESCRDFFVNEIRKHPEYHDFFAKAGYNRIDINKAIYGMTIFLEFYFLHDEFVHIESNERYQFCLNYLSVVEKLYELARIYTHYVETENKEKQKELLKCISDNTVNLKKQQGFHLLWDRYTDRTADSAYNSFVEFDIMLLRKVDFFNAISQLSNNEVKETLIQMHLLDLKTMKKTKDMNLLVSEAAYNRYLYENIANITKKQNYIELANQWKQTFESLFATMKKTKQQPKFLQIMHLRRALANCK